MRTRFASMLLLSCLIVASTLPGGCGPRRRPPVDTDLLEVNVGKPIVKDVTDYLDFTGRFDAINSVDVRARVTGYIVETPFKEGDIVTENQLLFKIDARPYKAKLDDAVAYLELQKAKLKLARADNVRAKKVAETPGAISKQELDKYQAGEEEARAAVNAASASTEIHKLNLDWCRVESPIAGRISRYFFTRGNLINQDTTLLTTVVSEDPIYSYFDLDDRSYLRVQRGVADGRIRPSPSGDIPVLLGLPDEPDFPHQGSINFSNNRIDPLTGTITVRGKFDNPLMKPPPGEVADKTKRKPRHLFVPGMFCRIRVPIGLPYRAVLVAERVLVTDQGLKNVYVLDADDKVQYRRVELGALQPDGTRIVLEGLDGSERVLISGLQVVRPGLKVSPEVVPMPVLPLSSAPKKKPASNGSVKKP